MVLKTASITKSKKGDTCVQWIAAILANTTLLTYGLQSGWISPMTKVLQSNDSPIGRPLSDNEIAFLASILCIAAVFSAPMYTYVAEKYGRKASVIMVAAPQALSWSIIIFANSFASLCVARVFCGLASGGCFCVVPLYTKEISQDDIRGLLGALIMLFQNIGIFAMYAMGACVDYYTVLWVSVSLPILTLLLMIKAPESPAFLMKIGKIDEAATTVALLRGSDICDKVVQNEMNSMRNEEFNFKSLPKITYLSIFKDVAWRRGFLLIMAIITIQGCNGNFAILTYANAILNQSGVTFSPELQTLSFPAVMIVGSFVSMCCVERIGRKPLQTVSLVFVTISMFCVAMIMLVQPQGVRVPGWVPVASIVVAVGVHAAGLLPVPYIVMSEMFNFQIRAKITGLIVTYAWSVSFVQLACFTPVSNALGIHVMFFGFCFINFIGIFVTIIFMPETKGKSVEQIEKELKRQVTHLHLTCNDRK